MKRSDVPAVFMGWAAALVVVLVLRAHSAHAVARDGGLSPTALRCEYLVNPLGIDEKEPRLSWVVESAKRGQRQTAYRVLVASRDEALKQDQGDLWDSGKVSSGETAAVVFAGKALRDHLRCHWKVKVWDKDGRESAWSEPAFWSVGFLDPSGWSAEWIGYDKARQLELPDAPFEPAKWVWFPGDKGTSRPKGQRLFVTTFALSPNARVDKAELLITSNGRYWFNVNGKLASSSTPGIDTWDRPRMDDITPFLKPGDNDVRVGVECPAEGAPGLLVKLEATTSDGKTHTLVSDGSWKTTDQPGANWHDRPLDNGKWPASDVVGNYGAAPWGRLKYARLILPPPAYLRTTFRVAKPVRSATLYATALGDFDLHLNGERVTEDRFNPGWTDYTKRVLYRAYDVTPLIREGDNALGAILGDGWYSGYIGWKRIRDHYGKRPRFRGQLRVDYADGSADVVSTGSKWKASTGAIREADFLMGEAVDARQAQDGWDTPGFDHSRWDAVVTGAEMNPVVRRHPGPPVRSIGAFKPVRVTGRGPGTYVLDLGQNFAGVARLTLTGEPGQKVTLRFAERLNPDGSLYTTNLRDARCVDTYVCRGGGVEVWEPRFTFHGFQYVEVSGLRSPPAIDTVTGVALSSDTPVAGSFECSDSTLNRLRQNIDWTQRSNFIDIPTDCPQRDERLGWTGDAQVYVRAASLNADIQAFFTKWLVDLDDGQRADGQFPMVAPVKVAGDDGGPAWADAGVICPWTVYDVYGDRRLLERHYRAMTRFIAFCQGRSTPELLPPKVFHCFGDWLSINADTPKDVIYTAYFAHSTRLTARAAEALGKSDDAARYRELFEKIKAAFQRAYVADDGRIKGNTQAVYVLALAFDLLDADKAKLAAEHLVDDIKARGWHLSTGFIGTKDLMLVLSKIGRDDVAYRLLFNDTFPSWGFSIRQGATSIWERWDGWTPEKGFQDPGMNSFAHYSFGAVYQWIVENIGGIKSDGPAYKKIVIAPKPGGRLTWARTSYRSIHGLIATDWRRDGDQLALNVTIPANTTATVHLPSKDGTPVTEGGRRLEEAEGVKVLRREGDRVVLEVGSGAYRFVSALAPPT
jgi:alpha-L-rhamnosidase